ncbi:MAG: rod shape-determining protein MreD [Pseudomonadota bacterium]
MKSPTLQAALFLTVSATIIFLQLLPLELKADAQIWPDLLFCTAAAWVLRRPDATPALLLVATFLAADFILSRPPGLWAFLALMATEFLRVQSRGHHDRPFLIEWLTFAALFGLMLFAQSLILTLALVPGPSAGTMLTLYLITTGLYPMVAFTLYAAFRVRAPRAQARRIGGVA